MGLGRSSSSTTILGGLALAFAFASTSLVGCGSDPKVIRVYDGRIVEGAFVPSDAYAAYLKGVLAEEAGDLRSALSAYELAAREDDEDAEPFTRIGDVRCKLDTKNRGADDAFAQALRIDKTYAPALAAQARCAMARGQTADAVAFADQSTSEDRTSASMESLFVKLAAQRSDNAAADRRVRERVIALTLASGEQVAAWDALIAWGRAKSDPELLARGFESLAHVAPMRAGESEAGALELLGLGQAGLARRVAASIADAPTSHGTLLRDATVARLAIDEALLAPDANIAAVERRATRGHVPLSEVAARALILERPDLAQQIARSVVAVDPNAGGAQMVLAAIAARAGKSVSASAMSKSKDGPTDRPSAACVLVLAERITIYAGVDAARAWVARVSPSPMSPHDPVVGPLAVDLAARGVIVENGLPIELRLELSARRREAPKPIASTGSDEASARLGNNSIDSKHMLLWHVLIDPVGAPARSLLQKMQNASDRDPIIGYALARAALASINAPPKSEAWSPVIRAIAASPAHPLLLAVAVDIAKKNGRADEIPPARARLMAVARTPAERALASE